eukprot:scaffold18452_cov64-Phaeocystis_antarctica.AAC.6
MLLVDPGGAARVQASIVIHHATRSAPSARGDMWALLVRQTPSTGPRRGHAAGQAARAVSSVPQSNLAASSARAAVCPPLGLFARPCSAAAAVLDDDLTLTSAASSSIALSFLCFFVI